MASDISPDLNLTIGAALIGFAVAAFLFGSSSGQAITYFANGTGQARRECYLVGIIWALSTLHIAFASYSMFVVTIFSRGNPVNLNKNVWAYGLVQLVMVLSNLFVRLGYAYRIWKLSGRRVPPSSIAITVVSLFIATLGIYSGITQMRSQSVIDAFRIQWSFYAVLSADIAVDSMIAITMITLLRRFNTGIQSLDKILKAISMYNLNTGVLTVLLAIVECILYALLPRSPAFISVYWALGHLHTLSFFTVLNAQEVLVAQTQTQRRANSRTEFTTALSVGADGSAAFVASAAWLSTFDLSSVGGSVESVLICEHAQPSAGAGAQRSVDIVVVMEHSLDFDFGLKLEQSGSLASFPENDSDNASVAERSVKHTPSDI